MTGKRRRFWIDKSSSDSYSKTAHRKTCIIIGQAVHGWFASSLLLTRIFLRRHCDFSSFDLFEEKVFASTSACIASCGTSIVEGV